MAWKTTRTRPMNVYSQLSFLSIWIILFVISCKPGGKDEDGLVSVRDQYQVEMDGQSAEQVFEEGPTVLSQIIRVEYLDDNRSIILDTSQRIHLFQGYKFLNLIGEIGEGPCEYSSVTSFFVASDTLYVTDRSQSKIVTYDISSNQCVREWVYEGIPGLTSIGVSGTGIYVTNGILVRNHLETETPFLYRLDREGTSQAMELFAHDLDALILPAPVRVQANMRMKDGNVYFYYPLSPKIFYFDPESGEMSSFSIPLDLAELSQGEMQNPQKMLAAMNETEMILSLHTLENYIAVVTMQGVAPDRTFRVKFIDYNGFYIDAIETPSHVVYVGNDHFITLHTDSTESLDILNKVIRQGYQIRETTNQ